MKLLRGELEVDTSFRIGQPLRELTIAFLRWIAHVEGEED